MDTDIPSEYLPDKRRIHSLYTVGVILTFFGLSVVHGRIFSKFSYTDFSDCEQRLTNISRFVEEYTVLTLSKLIFGLFMSIFNDPADTKQLEGPGIKIFFGCRISYSEISGQ